MVSHDEIADLLDDAADLVERNGWWNGRLNIRSVGDPVCALNAICRVAGRRVVLASETCRALEAYTNCQGIVPDWNDSFDNPQPVLDGMRKCAKELRMLG